MRAPRWLLTSGLLLVLTLPAWPLEITFPAEATGTETADVEGATAEVSGSTTVRAYDQGVSGNTPRSFKTPGTHHQENALVDLAARTVDGLEVAAQVGMDETDDPALTAGGPHTRFSGGYLTFERPEEFLVRTGTIPVEFSRYSLSRQVDGVAADLYSGNTRIAVSASRLQRGLEGVQPQRLAYGLRADHQWKPSGTGFPQTVVVGLNGVVVRDAAPGLSQPGLVTLADGRIASVDATLRGGGLDLSAEYAVGQFQPVTGGIPTSSGPAWGLRARWAAAPVRVGLTMEEFSPGFLNPVATAATDLRHVHGFLNYELTPGTDLDLQYVFQRNNLRGQLPVGFAADTLTARLTTLPWEGSEQAWLRPLGFAFGYRDDGRRASDGSTRLRTREQEAGLFYSYQGLRLDLSWLADRARDGAAPLLDRNDERLSARLSYRLSGGEGGWTWTPALRLNRFRSVALVPTESTNLTTDLGLGLVAERGPFRFSVGQDVTDSLRPLGALAPLTTRSSLTRANRADVSYGFGDTRLGVSWLQRRIADDAPGSSYLEQQVMGTLESRF